MAISLIKINGQDYNAASLTFPSTGREFRDAWTITGDVIEVDMVKARDVKIEKIVRKAAERVEKAEEQAMKKAMKGEDTSSEDAEVAKFKAKPKAAAVDLINNAATPEELDAITEDQVFA